MAVFKNEPERWQQKSRAMTRAGSSSFETEPDAVV